MILEDSLDSSILNKFTTASDKSSITYNLSSSNLSGISEKLTVIYEGLLILPISYNKIAKESKNSPFKPPLSPTKEPLKPNKSWQIRGNNASSILSE